jgi:hypothetical protein
MKRFFKGSPMYRNMFLTLAATVASLGVPEALTSKAEATPPGKAYGSKSSGYGGSGSNKGYGSGSYGKPYCPPVYCPPPCPPVCCYQVCYYNCSTSCWQTYGTYNSYSQAQGVSNSLRSKSYKVKTSKR